MALASVQKERGRSIARDVIGYAIAKVVPGMLAVLTVLVMIRVAGTAIYGEFAIWLPIAVAAGNLSCTWLTQSVLRWRLHPAFTNLWASRDFSAVNWKSIRFVVVVVAVLALCFRDWSAPHTLVTCFFIVAFHWYFISITDLQATRRVRGYVLMEITRAALALVAPVLLVIAFFNSPIFLLLGVALAYALPVVLMRSLMKESTECQPAHGVLLPKEAARVGRTFALYGMPVALWTSLMQLLPAIDRSILAQYGSAEMVGVYAGTFELAVKGLAIGLFPVTLAIHPRLMEAANAGRHAEIWMIMGRSLLLQGAVLAVAIVLASFVGEALLELVFESPVDGSVLLLILLITGGGLWQFALLMHKPMEIHGATIMMCIFMGVAVVSSALASIALVPRLGTIGSACGYIAGATIYVSLCALWTLRQRVGLKPAGLT